MKNLFSFLQKMILQSLSSIIAYVYKHLNVKKTSWTPMLLLLIFKTSYKHLTSDVGENLIIAIERTETVKDCYNTNFALRN